MPGTRHESIPEPTREAIRSYLRKFIEKLIEESRKAGARIEQDTSHTSDTAKPFHEAIIPAPVRAISRFERSFSTRLGSTFSSGVTTDSQVHGEERFQRDELLQVQFL